MSTETRATAEIIEELCLMVLNAGALEIRDVPPRITNEEVPSLPVTRQPFLYSSGNWGPGYVMIKGLVGRSLMGRKKIINALAEQLARRIAETTTRIDFVDGNATGGMIPGWLLSEKLEPLLGKCIPFVYMRNSRKKGGHKELFTGIANNPEIPLGAHCLVVEELVNFANTTCNAAIALRYLGYRVDHAATILFYNNPEALRDLRAQGIKMIYLFTLSDLLAIAEKHQTHPKKLIDDYRDFLSSPIHWQTERGLRQVESGGTQ